LLRQPIREIRNNICAQLKIREIRLIRGFYINLNYVEAEEYHEAVHEDPEDSERHCLAHDVTVLTLHVAGGSSNRDTLW
jgi:hypothetical protein